MIYTNTPSNTNTNDVAPAAQVQSGEAPLSEQTLNNDNNSQAVKEAALRKLIDGSIKQNESLQIVTGVQIMDMHDNHLIANHNPDTEQFAASINKLAVMLLVLHDLRGHTLKLDQQLSWQPSDVRGGNGVYDQPGAPTTATLKDVVYDLLNRSGNTAVRVLVNKALGGADQTNHRIHSYREMAHTYLQPLPGPGERFYLGNSTAHDSLWAMDQLTAYNDKYARFIKEAMATNIFNDYGVRSQLAGNDWIILINKVGILDDVDGNNRHDVGIIKNVKTHKSYGYSFMTTSPSASPDATPQADQSLKDMGRYLLRYAGDKPGGDKKDKSQAPSIQGQSLPPMEQKILY